MCKYTFYTPYNLTSNENHFKDQSERAIQTFYGLLKQT